MNVEELKLEIEKTVGVPALLLNGETSEEVISRAKALLAFKKDTRAEQPQSTSTQFSNWMKVAEGIEEPSEEVSALCALDQIAERECIASGGYPYIRDGGTPYINGAIMPDLRSNAQQFEDWMKDQTAYDPKKERGGWKPL